MSKSVFDVSPDARLLASRLSRLKPGEVITYKEIAGIVSMSWADPVHQAVIRGRLSTARRIVSRDFGIATGAVLGEGIKRLEANEIPRIGQTTVRHIHRAAKRSTKRMLEAAQKTEMSNGDRLELNANLSALGALAMFSSTKTVARIGQEVTRANSELPVGATLALFNGHKPASVS